MGTQTEGGGKGSDDVIPTECKKHTSTTGSAGLCVRRSAAGRRWARAASGMSDQDSEDASELSKISDARVCSPRSEHLRQAANLRCKAARLGRRRSNMRLGSKLDPKP